MRDRARSCRQPKRIGTFRRSRAGRCAETIFFAPLSPPPILQAPRRESAGADLPASFDEHMGRPRAVAGQWRAATRTGGRPPSSQRNPGEFPLICVGTPHALARGRVGRRCSNQDDRFAQGRAREPGRVLALHAGQLAHLLSGSPVESYKIPRGSEICFARALSVASHLQILHHLVSRSTHGGLLGLAGLMDRQTREAAATTGAPPDDHVFSASTAIIEPMIDPLLNTTTPDRSRSPRPSLRAIQHDPRRGAASFNS
jgi:hypothetical protein